MSADLCICAFWVEDVDVEAVTKEMADAVAGVPGRIPKSGAVVTINEEKVDHRLRAWLRAVQIEEAADR